MLSRKPEFFSFDSASVLSQVVSSSKLLKFSRVKWITGVDECKGFLVDRNCSGVGTFRQFQILSLLNISIVSVESTSMKGVMWVGATTSGMYPHFKRTSVKRNP